MVRVCLQHHNLRFCSKTKCTADRHRLSTEAYLRLIGPIREKRLSLLTCSSLWTKPLTKTLRLYPLQSFSKHMTSTNQQSNETNPSKKRKHRWKNTRITGSFPFLALKSSCCEFGIMRSHKLVEVVLHLLQHGIA